MKFKSISLLPMLISLVFGADEGPLTPKENFERLNNCGTDKTSHKPPWMFFISSSDSRKTIGSYISKRHALTTSMLVLNSNLTWMHDGKLIDCDPGRLGDDLEVPETMVKALYVTDLYINPSDIVAKAFLPEICSQKVKDQFSENFSPMILELKRNSPEVLFPCLSDKSEDIGKNREVQEYTHIRGGVERRTIQPRQSSIYPHMYFSPDHIRDTETGGFIAAEINKKITLLGIKTISHQESFTPRNEFYKLDYLYDSLCKLVKVCSESDTVPAETSTVPMETSSEAWSPTTSGSMESSKHPETPETSKMPSGTSEAPETSETSRTSDSPETTITTPLELTSSGPITSPVVTTVPQPLPSPPRKRTMPPEYIDNGDYDMIFDSLYEFPEFREIEPSYEKKGCYRTFELVFVVFVTFLV